jgi:cardiolipin synthase
MTTANDNRIMTVPNFLTLLRALGVPLFLWLFLAKHNSTLSFSVLAFGAFTDYLDGKIARALKQESKLGAAFDPTIDRLYIASTVVALAIRDFIPWWIVLILLVRDGLMVIALAVKKRRSGKVFQVTYLGKAATFNLLYAFPFFLLGGKLGFSLVLRICGWAFVWWGVGLYLLTAVQYSIDAVRSSPSNSLYD